MCEEHMPIKSHSVFAYEHYAGDIKLASVRSQACKRFSALALSCRASWLGWRRTFNSIMRVAMNASSSNCDEILTNTHKHSNQLFTTTDMATKQAIWWHIFRRAIQDRMWQQAHCPGITANKQTTTHSHAHLGFWQTQPDTDTKDPRE